MNKLFSVFCLSALLTATSAIAHEDHGKSMHGGVVAEAGHAQFEIVDQNGTLTVHVSDHGQPVATAGGSGKLTVLVGQQKSEIVLTPAGDNRLSAAGSLPPGARVLLNATLPGRKPLVARATIKAADAHAGH